MAGRMREWECRRFYLGFGFSLFTSGFRDAGWLARPAVDVNRLETIIELCRVYALENVGAAGADWVQR